MLGRLKIIVRALLHRRVAEDDLDDELRYHLDRLIAENVAAGMTPEQARLAARKEFGGFEQSKEECRDARGTRLLDDLLRDLSYGLRSLRHRPGFTVTVVLCLALGVGANITIFSLFNAALLRPLPVPQPEQLVRFSEGLGGGTSRDEKPDPGRIELFSFPLFQRLRAHSALAGQFQGLAAQQSGTTISLIRRSRGPESSHDDDAAGRAVTANFFQVLGVTAHRGRTFLPEDETTAGANPVLVLSHRAWQRRFGGDPALVGERLNVNGSQYTVVGVAAPGFDGTRVGDITDFWVPVTMQQALMRRDPMLQSRAWSWLHLFGRIRPGVALPTAESSANIVLQQFLAEDPAIEVERRRAVRIGLESAALGLVSVNQPTRHLLGVLLAGVALLLVIVCLNVSHLLLARALERHRELCIRAALGAGRGRLVRQLLTEGLLLAALGIAAAALVARGARHGLIALLDDGTPFGVNLQADARVLAFSAVLGLLTAAVLGLVPAWRAARVDLQDAMRSTALTIAGGGARRLRGRFLLSLQVALSLVLLVAAVVLTTSLRRLRDVPMGFETEQLLLVDINARMLGLDRERLDALHEDLLRRAQALPGVRGASLSSSALLSGGYWRDNIALPGRDRLRSVQTESVTPGYFEVVGMPIIRGRGFVAQDGAKAPFVTVINETLARRLFDTADAVGRRFRFEHLAGPGGTDFEVVGVVADSRHVSPRLPSSPASYFPVAQRGGPLTALVVRAAGRPEALAASVRAAVRAAHPGLPIVRLRTMQTQLGHAHTAARALAVLSAVFGLAALFIICIGLYGVVSQWAGQRRREIGVRMALGATGAAVRWLVLRQAFAHVLVGLLLGLPAAVAAARLLRGLVYGFDPASPPMFVWATALMVGVTTLAAYLPARRASRVHPMLALRSD